jgi:hypothetical protein
MAPQFIDVVALEAFQDDSQRMHFVALFEGPTGNHRVEVSGDAMLNYYVFQREVLSRIGLLFRHSGCDGRPELAANEQWKTNVAVWLNMFAIGRAAAQAAGAAN